MTTASEREEHRKFEADVRRVAEAVWALAPGECQPEHYSDNPIVTELDGLARLRDVTHLIMVTVSRRLDKAKDDVKKLNAAELIELRSGKPVQKWFITRDQLEAEHVKLCRESTVTALTLGQFQSRFFNGREYISKRRVSAFGSARNLIDDSVNLPEDEYVELPLRLVCDRSGRLAEPRDLELDELRRLVGQGVTVVLLAPFGAGKSLTAREVFLREAKGYLRSGEGRVPIAVNLRDHWGAKYADEILERHAREIGFVPREDVVAAWRAGLVTMILDGFDEVAAQAVARTADRNFMRDARLQALAGVQDLTAKVPRATGLLITGRDHYFDSQRELQHALGLTGRDYALVELGEFGERQAMEYLRRKGSTGALPSWLPRKPLILGYLASRDLLDQVLSIDGTQGFGYAWNEFLTRICQREAAHGRSAMDADTLRHLLERLAFDVRATSTGAGPITERDLAEAYLLETGDNPGEGVLMQLQRLPGLTARGQDVGVRSFIDEDMLAALQGSALARFILEGKPNWSRRGIRAPLQRAAIETAAHLIATAGGGAANAVTTARRLSISGSEGSIDPQVTADCLEVAFRLSEDAGELDCHDLILSGVYLSVLPLEGMRLSRLRVQSSLIDEVFLDESGLQSTIVVIDSEIQRFAGIADKAALPAGMFQDCTVQEFDDLSTNSAIVRSDLHPRLKALLTILRKLYLQAGGGRKLSALRRGLPPGPIAEAVDGIVAILESDGLAIVEKGVAHPVRKYVPRVKAILAAPGLSLDPIVARVIDR